MCFVNKMDRTGADFYFVLKTIKERLTEDVAVLQLPIGSESEYAGMIDLVKMKALVWPSDVDEKDLGATYNEEEIPEDMADEAAQYRSDLMDVLSLIDEDLMERYLGDEDISVDDLKAVIRKGTLAGEIVPILNGTAFKLSLIHI